MDQSLAAVPKYYVGDGGQFILLIFEAVAIFLQRSAYNLRGVTFNSFSFSVVTTIKLRL